MFYFMDTPNEDSGSGRLRQATTTDSQWYGITWTCTGWLNNTFCLWKRLFTRFCVIFVFFEQFNWIRVIQNMFYFHHYLHEISCTGKMFYLWFPPVRRFRVQWTWMSGNGGRLVVGDKMRHFACGRDFLSFVIICIRYISSHFISLKTVEVMRIRHFHTNKTLIV